MLFLHYSSYTYEFEYLNMNSSVNMLEKEIPFPKTALESLPYE